MSDDITWPKDFPQSLISAIREIMKNHLRVKVIYHDYTESGYISNSIGPHKALLIVHKSNSFGGTSMSQRIPLQIVSSSKKDGRVFWDFAKMEPILFVHTQ